MSGDLKRINSESEQLTLFDKILSSVVFLFAQNSDVCSGDAALFHRERWFQPCGPAASRASAPSDK